MKIKIEPYNKVWVIQFEQIKAELSELLHELNPEIEHFGSTSVPGLAAKPVIDVLIGIDDISELDLCAKKILRNRKYIYYKAFDVSTPERRLFVRLKDDICTDDFLNIFEESESIPHEKINQCRIAHIHVWKKDTEDWLRHIAFREYLKAHDMVKQEYEKIKRALSLQNWENGMEYNDGKNEFIKGEEKKAILWYQNTRQNIF